MFKGSPQNHSKKLRVPNARVTKVTSGITRQQTYQDLQSKVGCSPLSMGPSQPASLAENGSSLPRSPFTSAASSQSRSSTQRVPCSLSAPQPLPGLISPWGARRLWTGGVGGGLIPGAASGKLNQTPETWGNRIGT